MHEDEGQAEEEKGSQRAGREEQGAVWLPPANPECFKLQNYVSLENHLSKQWKKNPITSNNLKQMSLYF